VEPRLSELTDRFYRRSVELLERCGLPRSMPPFLVVGVLASLTSIIVAVLHLTTPGHAQDKPVVIEPAVAGQPGTTVVNSSSAQVQAMTMVARNRWAAGWSNCSPKSTCKYAAVIDRDGARATAPEWPVPYATLRAGGEAIAVAPPRGGTLDGGPTMMFRLTYDGPVLTRLRNRLPTTTFEKGEILSDQIVPGRIAVLNLEESTVRILQARGTRAPVCDESGRCWMLAGVGRTDLYWTDDGGRTWGKQALDTHNQLGQLAVSPNGRTVVTTAVTVTDRGRAVSGMRISTDRGATWTTVQSAPQTLKTPPLAFNDGTALMLGGRFGDRPRLYRVRDGAAKLDSGYPGDLADLGGDANLIYGFETPKSRTSTEVIVSTDQGASWTKFAPR
jgi:hypothetical protein